MGDENRCWAAGTTPCEGPITDEHYASYGLFLESGVLVQSGPLARNGPRWIPIKRLVTKCLCRGHNNGLSELDQAGIDFQNVLRRVSEIEYVRSYVLAQVPGYPWEPRRFVVDGPRVERWLFKFAFSAAPVFRHNINDWRPTPQVAALALGTSPIGDGLGLYTAMGVGHQAVNEERLTFSFGARAGGDPSAFALSLRGGYRFICAWEPARQDTQLVFDGLGGGSAASPLLRRPNRIDFLSNNRDTGLSLDFDWSGQWREDDNPSVVSLRKRYRPPAR